MVSEDEKIQSSQPASSEVDAATTTAADSAKLKRESVNSEFIVLHPNGQEQKLDLLKPQDVSDASLSTIIKNEVLGKCEHANREPPHTRLMRKLELVDYAPACDTGQLKYYPKGALVKDLLEDLAFDIAVRDLKAFKIETPLMYRWNEPDIRAQGLSFGERAYRIEMDEKNPLVMRFAGDFGLFRMMKNATITYKQTPVRVYEISQSFRYEQSGECTGLRRLRAFTMPDIHCFCKDLSESLDEYKYLYEYYMKLVKSVGIDFAVVFRVVKDFYENEGGREFILGLIKLTGRPAMLEVIDSQKHYWVIKHEFQFVDSIEGNAQLSTVQLDIHDGERYGITYVDEDGSKKPCIIVHSSMGSIERWIYALLEHAIKNKDKDGGSLPLWIAPVQVRVLPITDNQLEHAKGIAGKINAAGFRCECDDRSETLGKKIRDAETDWIPYIVIIGKKEVESSKLSLRVRGEGQKESTMEELILELDSKTKGQPKKPLYTPELLSRKPIFVSWGESSKDEKCAV